MSITTDTHGNIYAGGYFINTKGNQYIAEWNGTAWAELGGTNTSTFNNFIFSIATDANGNVYSAGLFTNGSIWPNNNPYVARWNGTAWSDLGGNNPILNNGIKGIATDANGEVYAGGVFANGYGKYYVAKWDGSSWSELGGKNTSTFNGEILSVTTDVNGNVYAGGWFTNLNRNYYVAKWNGTTWNELGGSNTSTFNNPINSITTNAKGNVY